MSYHQTSGRFVYEEDIDLSPAAAVTADAQSRVLEMGHLHTMFLELVVSAITASDTLDVTIQGSEDGTNWFTLGTFTQVSATGTQRKSFPTAKQVRADFNGTDAGGGMSFTFTLRGKAR
jgi:uncharacterized cupredoxin-like copper-binding protein